MRVKTYTAATIEKAMNKVRQEMGEEAVILSTHNMENGEIQLTAAVEQDTPPPNQEASDWALDWDNDWKVEAVTPHQKRPVAAKEVETPLRKPAPAMPKTAQVSANTAIAAATATAKKPMVDNKISGTQKSIVITPKMEMLVQSLAYHGVPTRLAEKLCRMALAIESDDTAISLAAALDSHYKYSPRIFPRKTPLMLIGPPGVGKTATIAKFAAAARMDGRKVHLITTDTSRAGAIEQLKSYTDILEFSLKVAETDKELVKLLTASDIADGADILIDTGGVNSYDAEEISALTRKIIAAKAEPVAVLAAGTDSAEMSDTAETFAALGARRMIITRLDTTRRYGGIFTAAHSAGLSFSYASISPSVATGLHVITPVNLARLLLRDPTETGISKEFDKGQP